MRQFDIQRERGRVVHQGWAGSPVAGDTTILPVKVRDRDGHTVSGARITGCYRVAARLDFPRIWQLVRKIQRAGEVHEVRASTPVPGRGKSG